MPRCGSLARIGPPVLVRAPESAQTFDPPSAPQVGPACCQKPAVPLSLPTETPSRISDPVGQTASRPACQGRRALRLGEQLLDEALRHVTAQAGTQEFGSPVSGQAQGHQPDPYEAVGDRPGLGFEPEGIELGRERTVVAAHPGVHPGCVGLEVGSNRCGQAGGIGCGEPVDAERAHHPVHRDEVAAEELRHPPGADPARQLHLREPVLRMDETDGESRVPFALRRDEGDPAGVARDHDRCVQAGQRDLAVQVGQRGSKPEPPRKPGQDEHRGHAGETKDDPAEHAVHEGRRSWFSPRVRAGSSRGPGRRRARSAGWSGRRSRRSSPGCRRRAGCPPSDRSRRSPCCAARPGDAASPG